MTSTNNKKSPVEYDSHRHSFYNHDTQHGTVQFCALRGDKDHGEWVCLEGLPALTPREIHFGAKQVLEPMALEPLEINTTCTLGVSDQRLRLARVRSKQLRLAHLRGRIEVLSPTV
jgi:hypothetical protein